jgi:hypothetical protein
MKGYCSITGKHKLCKYGGNKHFGYGFCSGMAEYCRKEKKWVCDMEKCPLEENNKKAD